jgi:acyl carrier protein
MNEQARAIVVDALADVAPEIDSDGLDQSASLREGADLDSMDFLAYVSNVSEALDRDIPEGDYAELDSVASAIEYVARRLVG